MACDPAEFAVADDRMRKSLVGGGFLLISTLMKTISFVQINAVPASLHLNLIWNNSKAKLQYQIFFPPVAWILNSPAMNSIKTTEANSTAPVCEQENAPPS